MYPSSVFISFSALAIAAGAMAKGVWITPHDSYSSTVGVLGCKVNTNRIAYWPDTVDCNNICVKLSYGGRSVHLLRIDQSTGAHDISYDAWAYLQTGKSAATDPITGGAVAMESEEVDASECADLIHTDGHKLPLSASNSMNFLSHCLLQQSDSWVANNYVLYNVLDPICSWGCDEECSVDLAASNKPTCPHDLGVPSPLTTAPVYNIQYGSGKTVVAGTGAAASPNETAEEDGDGDSDASQTTSSSSAQPTVSAGVFVSVSSQISADKGTPSSTQASATSRAATLGSTGVVQETRSSTLGVPTMTAQVTSSYTQSTASHNSTRAYTTLSKATVSSGQGTTASSSPASPSTVQTVSAGNASAKVPALALASVILICSILGAF